MRSRGVRRGGRGERAFGGAFGDGCDRRGGAGAARQRLPGQLLDRVSAAADDAAAGGPVQPHGHRRRRAEALATVFGAAADAAASRLSSLSKEAGGWQASGWLAGSMLILVPVAVGRAPPPPQAGVP